MNDTRTVRQSYVVVVGNVISVFLRVSKIEQRFVVNVLKMATFVCFQNGVGTIFEMLRYKFLCKDVLCAVFHLDGNVVVVLVHAQCNVAGQSPRGGCPSKKIGIGTIHKLKFCNGGFFLNILVALCNFVTGKRRSATWAIRHDFETFVQQTFVVDGF